MSTYYKKRNYPRNKSVSERIIDNYDLILYTAGAMFLLGYLGFPILKQTTTIETTNPNNLK